MIREELLVQRGKELDVVSTDPEVRAAIVNAVELEMAADAITSQPTEAAPARYYAAHRARYASEGVMTLRDWVFAAGDRGRRRASRASPEVRSAVRGPHCARGAPRTRAKWAIEEFYFAAKIHLGRAPVRGGAELARRRGLRAHRDGGRHPCALHARERPPVPFDFPRPAIRC